MSANRNSIPNGTTIRLNLFLKLPKRIRFKTTVRDENYFQNFQRRLIQLRSRTNRVQTPNKNLFSHPIDETLGRAIDVYIFTSWEIFGTS